MRYGPGAYQLLATTFTHNCYCCVVNCPTHLSPLNMKWNYPFPFLFPNSQMSFPLTPGLKESLYQWSQHLKWKNVSRFFLVPV